MWDSVVFSEDTSIAQFIADPVNRAHYWSYPAASEWSLDSSQGHALSLAALVAFAKAQRKPVAICETGAGNSNAGTDVSDDPTFPQWLASQMLAARADGMRVAFVDIWDSNGGGNYEFSFGSDNKPQEAAAWGASFGN
jgi:protocatechuate 3,4-dioxygenase beta subunit